jgi:hypothetical protein
MTEEIRVKDEGKNVVYSDAIKVREAMYIRELELESTSIVMTFAFND